MPSGPGPHGQSSRARLGRHAAHEVLDEPHEEALALPGVGTPGAGRAQSDATRQVQGRVDVELSDARQREADLDGRPGDIEVRAFEDPNFIGVHWLHVARA